MGLWDVHPCFTCDWIAWLCTSNTLPVRDWRWTAAAAAHFITERTLGAVDERRSLPPLLRSGGSQSADVERTVAPRFRLTEEGLRLTLQQTITAS
jgi:hypothetical protein